MVASSHVAAVRRAGTYGVSLASPLIAPRKRFVLIGVGRVGSELLMDLLDSHPDIVGDGEILTQDDLLWPKRVVEWRATRAGLRGCRAYGYKVLSAQLRRARHLGDPGAFLRRQAERGVILVHLRRRNLLAVAVSFMQAERIGWHHRSGSGPTGNGPLILDPLEVLLRIHWLADADAWTAGLLAGVDHLEVIYEHDLEPPERHQATVDRITSRLGLPSQPVTSDLVRVTPRRLSERLANYGDIAALLGETPYRRFLEGTPPTACPPGG